MYDYLVYGGIIIILICLGYKYINWHYIFKKREDEILHKESEIEKTPEPDTPLTTKVFSKLTAWKEEKDYLRGKDIFNVLDGIHFWVSIIGFYYLMKIIFTIAKFGVAFFAAKEANDLLNQLFNVTF